MGQCGQFVGQVVQCWVYGFGCGGEGVVYVLQVECGVVYGLCFFDEVVCFVYQQGQLLVLSLGEVEELVVGVEGMVYVVYYDVGLVQQFLVEVVGVDVVLQCDVVLGCWVQLGCLYGFFVGGGQLVVEVVGQWVGVVVVGFSGMFIGLFFGYQGQYVQWQFWVGCVQCLQGIQCGDVVGVFVGYVVDFVEGLGWYGVQQWVEGVQGFVDVGWCLGQQVVGIGCGVEDGFGQQVLARVQFVQWEGQFVQCCVVGGVVCGFVGGLCFELVVVCFEGGLQGCGCGSFMQYGFVLGVSIDVDQGQFQFCQVVVGGDEGVVGLQLGLVQGVVVVGDGFNWVVDGFDFFQLVYVCFVVIGVVVYVQCVLVFFQWQFGFVVW